MPDDDGPLTTHCILQILIKATYLEKVTHTMKEMFKSSPLYNYERAPFISSILVLALLNRKESIQRSSHTLNTVSTWTVDWQQGFERVYVSGDGNYFLEFVNATVWTCFQKYRMQRLASQTRNTWRCTSSSTTSRLAWNCCWKIHNTNLFLTNSTVCEIASAFLKVDEFNHDLGNTIPLAMANATNIKSQASAHPLYLLFLWFG